jgi:TonB family protein
MDINADAKFNANEKIDVFAEEEEAEEMIEDIFTVVEDMPYFPGCADLATRQERKQCTEKTLLEHVYKHLRYPTIAKENGIEGVVVISFVVDQKGAITNAKIIRDLEGGCGKEGLYAINTLNSLPKKWTPGKQRDRAVPVRYNVPIRFRLNGSIKTGKRENLRSIPINRDFDLPRRRQIQKLARNSNNRKYYRAREFSGPAYDRDEVIEKRTDFRSTTYWNGNVAIDRKGKAVLEFYNSDAVTSFKITAEGFASDGMVGRAEKLFFTQMPFSLSAKLPVEVVTEDVVKIPLTLVNNTKKTITGALEINYPKGLSPKGNLPTSATLTAGQAKTQYLAFDVKERGTADKISIAFRSSGFNDEIEKPLTVISKGFPVSVAVSGEAMTESYPFDINNIVKGSLDAYVTAYPSAMSDMLSGLESMLRQPSGCFEQTSSSTYPNILVLNYLQETGQANPNISAKAKNFIAAGYKRLAGYESASGGFEWFGGDPGHEGLTAYGLMEFVDMKKVYDGVDEAMINRTTAWLMKRRDGMGKFKRNPRALHQFGLTNNETMSIYITWALSEANFTDIQTEVDFAYAEAKKTKNPYQLGLAANILFNRNDETRGQAILDLLMDIQADEGAWLHDSKHKSAPGSSGNALRIETAALAALATMKSQNPNRLKLKNCMDFIKKSRSSFGGYSSTNSTVLALRALVAYAKFSKRTDESGTIDVYVNGKKAKTFNYEKGHQEPIVLAGLESFMSTSKNDIEVKFSNTKTALPYTVAMNYSTALPNSQEACVIKLKTKIAKTKIKVGETVRLKTTLTNSTAEGQPMTMAIVGLPAGLTAQPWQLKELLDKKAFDFYEVIGNNLVFYYRQMKPSEERIINLDLKADIAGSFDAPASSAYLYYTDELKDWTSLERIEVRE